MQYTSKDYGSKRCMSRGFGMMDCGKSIGGCCLGSVLNSALLRRTRTAQTEKEVDVVI